MSEFEELFRALDGAQPAKRSETLVLRQAVDRLRTRMEKRTQGLLEMMQRLEARVDELERQRGETDGG